MSSNIVDLEAHRARKRHASAGARQQVFSRGRTAPDDDHSFHSTSLALVEILDNARVVNTLNPLTELCIQGEAYTARFYSDGFSWFKVHKHSDKIRALALILMDCCQAQHIQHYGVSVYRISIVISQH